jgi:indole-3-glycerol phosphate synthase
MPDDLHVHTDILAQICADTRAEVDRRRTAMPLAALKSKIAHLHRRDQPRGFADALAAALMAGHCGLIAEIKRTSPSGGVIRAGLDVASVAREYQQGGAVCLSVLTDGPHFGGSIADLQAARAAVSLPVLRKDFILDPWQVYESRLIGTDSEAIALEGLARDLDLDVLVEVHDQRELERALGLQTKLIGINNRNLKTLQTDIETTIELAPLVSCERMLVTESGIRGHEDLKRLAAVGAHCLLVGESLLRQPDLVAATKDLLGRTE